MEVKIKQDENGQKIYKIVWPDTQLDFLLADRDSAISYDKEAVYILMDKFRRCFYIGETGATKGGGVANRFRTHKWEKEFWDSALVIRDRNGEFDSSSTRAWFEWKLNDIAKAANTAVILSRAGKQEEPVGVKKRLNDILAVCRFIGISWAFYEEENKRIETAEKTVSKKSVKTKPSDKSVLQSWTGKTQLARLIARREGKPGSLGHLLAFLGDSGNKSRRRCPKDSVWRKPLEVVGIKFDKDDFVSDWTCAKNPL